MSSVVNIPREPEGLLEADLLIYNPNELSVASSLDFLRLYQPVHGIQRKIKRVIDITVSTAFILGLSPLWLFIALLIKLTSAGPVFYKSHRIGYHQMPFTMYKFRTMYVGADKQRELLRQQHNQDNELFKLRHDPRVTFVGAWLRRLSLDEFPQLLNVIRGEMSLVGPRPFAPDDAALFSSPYTIRYVVPPGMTGKWQVSGRSLLNFQDVCQLDAEYVLHWSLLSDMTILLRTIPALIFNQGAY